MNLVLILKIDCPEVISQYCPISICNVLYKLITKTLVNRMKFVLPSLVGPEQSSFVSGRQIMDNVVIYQKTLHFMRLAKGDKGYMAIKIDFENAYDRLNWDFISWTLESAGFCDLWVNIISNCI